MTDFGYYGTVITEKFETANIKTFMSGAICTKIKCGCIAMTLRLHTSTVSTN